MFRSALRVLFCAALVASATTPSQAFFHLMFIDEVYAGHPADPDLHYVVLRMYLRGENLVGGHSIRTFNADGTAGPIFGTFPSNVANGALNASILMGTASVEKILGVRPDHVTTGRLPFPSGRICFDSESIDCVAYGAFTGNNGVYGQPAAALQVGRALERVVSNVTVRNNANDFAIRLPSPTNNSGTTITPDDDGDLVPNATDCSDGDASVWFAPFEVAGVQAALDPALATLLRWSGQALTAGTFTLYDVALGSVLDLKRVGSYAGVASCGARDLLDPSFTDLFIPVAADGRFYLVRARNGCGVGTYGDGKPPAGLTDPRDFLDDPLTDPCAAR